jgi:hypothetical protein
VVNSWDGSGAWYAWYNSLSQKLYSLCQGFEESLGERERGIPARNLDPFKILVTPFLEASDAEMNIQERRQTVGLQIHNKGATLGRLLAILSTNNGLACDGADPSILEYKLNAHWQAHSVFPDSVGILKTLADYAFAIGNEAEALSEGAEKDTLNALKNNVLFGCYQIANELTRHLQSLYDHKPESWHSMLKPYGLPEDLSQNYGVAENAIQAYEKFIERLQEKNGGDRYPPLEGPPYHINERQKRIQQRLDSYEEIPQLLTTLEELNEKILAQGLSSTWPSPLQSQGRT